MPELLIMQTPIGEPAAGIHAACVINAANFQNGLEEIKMYSSNLMFHTIPGKTAELENQLRALRDLVRQAGGDNLRILHAHFASPEAPDVVFVQDAPDLATLEK